MAEKIRVVVIGAGALGKEHARLYAAMAAAGAVDFGGLYDVNRETAERVSSQLRVPRLATLDEAMASGDTFSVVTPTATHHDVARRLLGEGKHVLLEKPMTRNAREAAELIELARRHGCILQVGHVERFNPVFRYLAGSLESPRFIEAHRLSPFPARSTDIGVVLDLMIHDLDVVLALVRSPVVQVDAVGIPVLSSTEDIANARLRFANGCLANLTASRVSPERLRKIRVFSGGHPACYVSLDYRAQQGFIYRLAREDEKESSFLKKLLSAHSATIVSEYHGRKIVREPVPLEHDEPLKLELQSFIACVQSHQTPLVSGESAKRALDLALDITRMVQEQAEFGQLSASADAVINQVQARPS
jgi:predicted dehydrogenase